MLVWTYKGGSRYSENTWGSSSPSGDEST